MNDS
jgi:hypothetical protein